MTQLISIARFERFFRAAASLKVEKSDLKRYTDFVNQKAYDLLLIGHAHAKANAHSLIEPFDLPITKGLQECIHRFREMDETIELQPILDHITRLPPPRSTATIRAMSLRRSWAASVSRSRRASW
jgi:hypothetical protein